MRRNQKIITTVLWSFLVLTMIAVVGMGMWARGDRDGQVAASGVQSFGDAPLGQGLPILFDAPHLKLTDQNGRPFDSDALKGDVWVAAFIFTNCPGVCPMMTQKMAKLQETVPSPDVKLVSITVDPARDTPEVLKEYAKRANADEARWHFLTGSQEDILAAAAGLKLSVQPAKDGLPIQHAENFLLVDRKGRVRGAYHSKDEDALKQLPRDAETLLK
jgi:protein SCO1/2